MESINSSQYSYDSNHVRYELYSANDKESYNWIFLPGGPGADSSYYRSLIDILNLPGSVWLVDMPGNGTNVEDGVSYDYDEWFGIFPSIIQKFENPILVGHSFGGMFPLLFPELENQLKGFVILSSAPSLWLEAAVEYAKQFDFPDMRKQLKELALNPSQRTFEIAIDACMPYYFPKETLEEGRALVSKLKFQYLPAGWWQKKAVEINFTAEWIPQNVPTLIFGSKYDCICPFSLFENDERFDRDNIELIYVENAGHFIWVENPQIMVKKFGEYISKLNAMSHQ